jgi:predicted alpha/beta-hydrolase family hydrolase
MTSTSLRITIDASQSVSALLDAPPKPGACLVLAHGAGAGMAHPFMASVAAGLRERDVAVLRYQFVYMEQGSRRPDRPALAQGAVRAAVARAAELLPGVPLFVGGKSFGGRMSSQAQAEAPMQGVRGLVFFGFPLHAAGKPADTRAAHLADVKVPMLFLQGSRDKLAELDLLRPVVAGLGRRAKLVVVEQADHSFHVPVRSGRNDGEVMAELLDTGVEWMGKLAKTAAKT